MPFESHLGGPSQSLQFTADAKYGAVLRVLRGEDSQRVAAELNISRVRLQKWEARFLDGARKGLTSHKKQVGLSAIFNSNNSQQKKGIGWGTLLVVLVISVYFFVRFMGSGSHD